MKNLNLYKYYEKFSSEYTEDDKEYCKHFFTADLLFEGVEALEICAKLHRNFKIISNPEEKLNNPDGCRYLKFWLNDHIISYGITYNSYSDIVDNWTSIENHATSRNMCDNADILNYYDGYSSMYDNYAYHFIQIIYEYLHNAFHFNNDDMLQEINYMRNDIKDGFFINNVELLNQIKDMCTKGSSDSSLCKIYKKCDMEKKVELSQLEDTLLKYTKAKEKRRLEDIEAKKLASLHASGTSESSSSAGTIATSFIFVIMGILCILLILYKVINCSI